MYDITSSSSYKDVQCSLRHLKDIFPNYDTVIMLIGVKGYLHHERAVTTDEAMEFASMYQKCMYISLLCIYPCNRHHEMCA